MRTLRLVLANKRAESTAAAFIKLKAYITMIFVSGSAFEGHGVFDKQLNMISCFCDLYASWQKGGVENGNSHLRRDLPRTMSEIKMRKEEFNEALEKYNSTPLKSTH